MDLRLSETKLFTPFRFCENKTGGLYMLIGVMKTRYGDKYVVLTIDNKYIYCLDASSSLNMLVYASGKKEDFIETIMKRCKWGDSDGMVQLAMFNIAIGKDCRNNKLEDF